MWTVQLRGCKEVIRICVDCRIQYREMIGPKPDQKVLFLRLCPVISFLVAGTTVSGLARRSRLKLALRFLSGLMGELAATIRPPLIALPALAEAGPEPMNSRC